MNRIFKYGIWALAVLAVPAVLQSCHDDKDIVVIDEELPLKVDHLYMVGDATPAGWSIDNPAELYAMPAISLSSLTMAVSPQGS